MSRAVLTVAMCGLLFGCGGAPVDEQLSQDNEKTQSPPAESPDGPTAGNKEYTADTPGAYVTFSSYGDDFVVHDNAPDGHSAVVQVQNMRTSELRACWNPKGAGTVKVCPFNFPEGTPIRFQACLGEGESEPNPVIGCGAWVDATT